ncbi:AAA family ATPase [Amycolatopsis pithecellobii]|uniref:AAA family ATPase n=1 Tax=Amycolatopsis pithecellobii TaxID=664692 RepID=A0A6N7YMD3_9PSEU|nr:ATP-binding protein [Amycolatopsis pithecellobii]MTD54125.1 AAA family ATPase [Amycolatopsis pithecellobii]
MPAAPGDTCPVVPVAAVYGGNASGKSNLLDGLNFMRSAVLHSFAHWDVEGFVPRRPFKPVSGRADIPSVFVVELITEGIRYTYGFSLDDRAIVEEWLYSYPEKRKRVIFERVRHDIKLGSTVTELKSKLQVMEELTRPNALFLSAGARVNLEPLLPVYRWFATDLVIRSGDDASVRDIGQWIKDFVSKDSRNQARLVALLAAADVGVRDLRLDERDPAADDPSFTRPPPPEYDPDEQDESVRRRNFLAHAAYVAMGAHVFFGPEVELKFLHGPAGAEFTFDEESAGTRNWLALLPTVLEALDEGHVVVVDEIDTSLHPLLTARLVTLFRDEETNPNNAQLLFTTHDTSLLGTMLGDQVLDRDQIWFVEKRRDGSSDLYPLSDFKPRKDQNTERRYLAGSYGAVPVLGATDFADAVLGR